MLINFKKRVGQHPDSLQVTHSFGVVLLPDVVKSCLCVLSLSTMRIQPHGDP